MKPRTAFLLLALVLLLPTDLLAQGCSMCKATVESNDAGGTPLGNGLNNGILYLMAVPYVLIFLFFRKRIFSFFRELSHAQG